MEKPRLVQKHKAGKWQRQDWDLSPIWPQSPWRQPPQHKHMPHDDLIVSSPAMDTPAATSPAGVTTPPRR